MGLFSDADTTDKSLYAMPLPINQWVKGGILQIHKFITKSDFF